jgi:hypothetical protein
MLKLFRDILLYCYNTFLEFDHNIKDYGDNMILLLINFIKIFHKIQFIVPFYIAKITHINCSFK